MSTETLDAQALDQLCVNTIRTLSMDAVQKANSGHPGTPMALAPITYVLYTRVMRHNPGNADWFDRDRFVLSCGHASMLLYSMLYLTGYGLQLDDLKSFRQLGSPCAGHPERQEAAGIEATTGPLGQGISMSVGLALAERMLAARFNVGGHEPIDHNTFTIVSDGDLEEGISGEASSLAGHLGLGRLIAFYDDNHISIEGDTALAFSEDVGKRYEAYGWHVQNLGEDLELERIEEATRNAIAETERPSMIICRTHIAPGSPNKQDTHGAHGSPLGEDEVRLTKEVYGWPPDEQFYVPEQALEHFRACLPRGAELEESWNERARSFQSDQPELWEQFKLIRDGRLPDAFGMDTVQFDPLENPTMATRKAGNAVIQWAARSVPHFVGGSADLAPSTLTLIDGGGDVAPGDYAGRNLHFGIREHAMGAIVNGLVLHGFRAFGSGFLIFSDYMKAAIRLSAVMEIPSLFVFTHDSIGVGEDGPTHQPIEQLVTLRATPNLYLIRPSDANETAQAFKFALEQTEHPCAIALSRQALPVWRVGALPRDGVARGAFVLRESYKGAQPDLILIGTGSEVSLCNKAADVLEAEGIATRVVSMPCVERFEEQDENYRNSVLAPACRARVAVEAASPIGWDRFVGDAGEVVGMTTFGASAPATDVYKHFGITPDRVVERGRAVVEAAKA
ncbi:MAG TPA: transketolase [Solirubrobacteraceae bacterium]|nr:transketolase [Solirubrobacteraceae bacterium]